MQPAVTSINWQKQDANMDTIFFSQTRRVSRCRPVLRKPDTYAESLVQGLPTVATCCVLSGVRVVSTPSGIGAYRERNILRRRTPPNCRLSQSFHRGLLPTGWRCRNLYPRSANPRIGVSGDLSRGQRCSYTTAAHQSPSDRRRRRDRGASGSARSAPRCGPSRASYHRPVRRPLARPSR